MASRIARLLRRPAASIGLGLAAVLVAAPADAASPVCTQLETELAAIPQGAATDRIARFDRALETQRSELANAESQSRRLRCGFAIFGGNVARCASLNGAIERMQENLFDLGRQRQALIQGPDPARERERIRAALRINACLERDETVEAAASTDPGAVVRAPSMASASSSDDRDRSIGSFTVIAPSAPSPREKTPSEKKPSIPPLRIRQAPDTHTATIREEDATAAETAPTATKPRPAREADRTVRVVGPRFLPDPSTAIDLRDPGLPSDR